MKAIPNIFKTGAMVLTIVGGFSRAAECVECSASAGDTYQKQSQGNAVGNAKPTTRNESATIKSGIRKAGANDRAR